MHQISNIQVLQPLSTNEDLNDDFFQPLQVTALYQ